MPVDPRMPPDLGMDYIPDLPNLDPAPAPSSAPKLKDFLPFMKPGTFGPGAKSKGGGSASERTVSGSVPPVDPSMLAMYGTGTGLSQIPQAYVHGGSLPGSHSGSPVHTNRSSTSQPSSPAHRPPGMGHPPGSAVGQPGYPTAAGIPSTMAPHSLPASQPQVPAFSVDSVLSPTSAPGAPSTRHPHPVPPHGYAPNGVPPGGPSAQTYPGQVPHPSQHSQVGHPGVAYGGVGVPPSSAAANSPAIPSQPLPMSTAAQLHNVSVAPGQPQVPQPNVAGPTPQVPPQQNTAVPTPQVPPQHNTAGPTPQVPVAGPTPRVPPQHSIAGPTPQVPPQQNTAGPTPQVPPQHNVAAATLGAHHATNVPTSYPPQPYTHQAGVGPVPSSQMSGSLPPEQTYPPRPSPQASPRPGAYSSVPTAASYPQPGYSQYGSPAQSQLPAQHTYTGLTPAAATATSSMPGSPNMPVSATSSNTAAATSQPPHSQHPQGVYYPQGGVPATPAQPYTAVANQPSQPNTNTSFVAGTAVTASVSAYSPMANTANSSYGHQTSAPSQVAGSHLSQGQTFPQSAPSVVPPTQQNTGYGSQGPGAHTGHQYSGNTLTTGAGAQTPQMRATQPQPSGQAPMPQNPVYTGQSGQLYQYPHTALAGSTGQSHQQSAQYPHTTTVSATQYPQTTAVSAAQYPQTNAVSAAQYPQTTVVSAAQYPQTTVVSAAQYPQTTPVSTAQYPQTTPVSTAQYPQTTPVSAAQYPQTTTSVTMSTYPQPSPAVAVGPGTYTQHSQPAGTGQYPQMSTAVSGSRYAQPSPAGTSGQYHHQSPAGNTSQYPQTTLAQSPAQYRQPSPAGTAYTQNQVPSRAFPQSATNTGHTTPGTGQYPPTGTTGQYSQQYPTQYQYPSQPPSSQSPAAPPNQRYPVPGNVAQSQTVAASQPNAIQTSYQYGTQVTYGSQSSQHPHPGGVPNNQTGAPQGQGYPQYSNPGVHPPAHLSQAPSALSPIQSAPPSLPSPLKPAPVSMVTTTGPDTQPTSNALSPSPQPDTSLKPQPPQQQQRPASLPPEDSTRASTSSETGISAASSLDDILSGSIESSQGGSGDPPVDNVLQPKVSGSVTMVTRT